MSNPFSMLKDLSYRTHFIDTTDLKGGSINKDTLNQLKNLGVSIDKLSNEISLNLNMSYDRWQLYYEVTKSLDHWMMSSATELYADFATTYSPMNNATVWITGESRYVEILTKLINDIGIEEKIFDWAYNVGAFGDLFVKINAAPEFGIISIDDNRNPLEISRADYNGDLIGFYETPAGIMTGSNETNDKARLIAPWEYVHLRLLGVKRRRPLSGDPMNSEFRSLYILNPDNRQISSKYGTCVPGFTPIETDDGTHSIYDIVSKKLNVKVKSYNLTTREIEYKPIVNWFRRRNSEDLIRIKFNSRNTGKQILCTPNHLILTAERGWVEAKNITLNDKLMVESVDLSNDQKQILIGGILGDGSFGNKYLKKIENYQCGEFRFTQALRHESFFDWIGRNISNLEPSIRTKQRKSRVSNKYNGIKELSTRKCVNFEHIYNLSYHHGKKVVTKGLLDLISPLGLAVWIMGDGSFSWSGGNRYKGKAYTYPQFVLCTDSFSRKECELIQKWFKDKFDLNSRIACPPSTNKYRVHVGTKDTKKLINIIKDYLFVDGVKKVWIAKDINISDRVIAVPTNVMEIAVNYNKTFGDEVFDIEVQDNHNFLVSGAVIHNSLMINGLATYKRLKLAEDSLLLARVTRGTIKYLYKLKVDGTNMEAVNELVDLYSQTLKRARALNTNPSALNFDEKANSLTVMEDLFIPVWGDVGDLKVEKIGEDADIRWIVDIEELRNQLSCALRCPLSLLGGYTKEASGSLGSEAMEQLDYRFARSARRLQRALINGITKLCQIHLAYKNLDPDPRLFQVCMSETSTAEEEHVRKSLESGITTVRSIIDIAKEVDKNADFVGLFDYLNDKILKLQGFNLKNFASNGPKKEKKTANVIDHVENKDLHGFLPLKEGKSKFISYTMSSWEEKYKNAEIIVTKKAVKK